MSNLRIDIDYIKVSQFLEVIKHYTKKVEVLLDEAAIKSKEKDNIDANKIQELVK